MTGGSESAIARACRVRTFKWPEDPHWEYTAVSLGADAFGYWLGVAEGTFISRPGAGFSAHCDQVLLIPHEGWWVARFYGEHPGRPVDVYVDIATPADWDEDEVTFFDLDLDVLRGTHGRVWVDDEDEFAVRRRGYPERVVSNALEAVAEVTRALQQRTDAFADHVSAGWLARLRRLADS